jgi:hypothetical protein
MGPYRKGPARLGQGLRRTRPGHLRNRPGPRVPGPRASAAGRGRGGEDIGQWRLLRARNKWQLAEDTPHHPYPGTYPVVVTDPADWGGWRVPGAEYDRDPDRIEFQARLIAAAPQLMSLAQSLIDAVAESPEDAPPESLALARQARDILKTVTDVLATPPETVAPKIRAQAA